MGWQFSLAHEERELRLYKGHDQMLTGQPRKVLNEVAVQYQQIRQWNDR